jgi:putative nucleotidyltransferase with HDIG domain
MGRYGRAYVGLVVLLGAAAIADCLVRLAGQPVSVGWLVLAASTWISGAFALRVPQVPASISVSETFVFMILLLFGGPPATLTVAVDGLLTSMRQDRVQLRRLLFNVAEPAVSTWVAWHAFAWISGSAPLVGGGGTLATLVVPVLLMASVYFLMNSGLTALAVATDTGESPLLIWRTHFVGVSLSYFAGASVALLVVLNTRELSWGSLGVVVPLVLLLYATFSGRIRRSEDTNRHLAQLNRLHLSTVESLAMAIDAKDQITHGHIRRVQAQALELARVLGLSSEDEIKALEAAALLHDMGKLAVPDYILNKPGRLTPSEYERVKHHAVVGADILSAVEFPYPVVPIVKHHHENWDGSGYPDGLRGDEIPIGARILAVVDCYDALTSDRPYRRALPPHEALRIVESRRGREYDPEVVDAFVELQPSLAPPAASGQRWVAVRDGIVRASESSTSGSPAPRGPLPAIDQAATVFDTWSLLWAAGDHLDAPEIIELVALRVRRLTPSALVMVFRADAAAQELVLAHASGVGESRLAGLRVPFGRGTAGWVAVNRAPAVNGDPAIDAGTRLQEVVPSLESSLALPLVSGTTLVGVMTCCAPARESFADVDRRLAGALSVPLAFELQRKWDAPVRPAQGDSGPGGRPARGVSGRCGAVIVARLERHEGSASQPVSDDTLRETVEAVACRVVRASDLVVRGSDGEIVLLLAHAGTEAVVDIAARLRAGFDAAQAHASLRLGVATAPADGSSLDDLLAVAHLREWEGRQSAVVVAHRAAGSDRGGRVA